MSDPRFHERVGRLQAELGQAIADSLDAAEQDWSSVRVVYERLGEGKARLKAEFKIGGGHPQSFAPRDWSEIASAFRRLRREWIRSDQEPWSSARFLLEESGAFNFKVRYSSE